MEENYQRALELSFSPMAMDVVCSNTTSVETDEYIIEQ